MRTPSLSDSWTSQCVCRYLEFITMFSQISMELDLFHNSQTNETRFKQTKRESQTNETRFKRTKRDSQM